VQKSEPEPEPLALKSALEPAGWLALVPVELPEQVQHRHLMKVVLGQPLL
jgi:hypothetical protein